MKSHLRKFMLCKYFSDWQLRRPCLNTRRRISNKTRQVCRWSGVFNNCEIGGGVDSLLLCDWFLLPIPIHMIFNPMAQLKDSFFSGSTTFTFWNKTYTFFHKSWRLLSNLQVDNIPFFQRPRTKISRFHSLVWWHVSIVISSRTPVCKMSRILTNYNTYVLPHYWYL